MNEYLEEYLSYCDELLEKTEQVRDVLVNLKLSGDYDENILYDALHDLDNACTNIHNLSYMAIGTRIKRLVN